MEDEKRKKGEEAYNELLNDEVVCLKIPWKGIALAFFLSFTGLWLLCFGILTTLGYLDRKYEDRIYTFLILGGLTFIPGAYHLFIAYCAYTKKPGYSFCDIPDFD